MNANELMIGDWMRCTDPKPFRIEQIDGIEELVYGDDGFFVDTADLQPIPLTVEILEKNGWKKEDVFGSLIKYSFIGPIDIETGGEMFRLSNNYFFCSRIHYVHELQHALRMCGVEKDITI